MFVKSLSIYFQYTSMTSEEMSKQNQKPKVPQTRIENQDKNVTGTRNEGFTFPQNQQFLNKSISFCRKTAFIFVVVSDGGASSRNPSSWVLHFSNFSRINSEFSFKSVVWFSLKILYEVVSISKAAVLRFSRVSVASFSFPLKTASLYFS
jgi:hypothetical protein